MGLGATLATAFSGLRTAQQGLNLTAHNVANVNTEGYSRKVLAQETVVVSNRGAGVAAEEITRLTDRFLTQEVRRQSGQAAQAEVVSRYHDRLQDFIGAPGEDRDLAVQMGELAAAIDGFANSPEVSANALEVVNLAESVGLSIGSLADQVQRLRADADREIGLTVSEVNGELESIAELNREISRLTRMGQDTSELLDQRDARLESLAEKIDIDTFVKDGDILVVQTGGGHTLADDKARVLVYEPATQVGHDTVLNRLAVFRQDEISAATGQPLDPNGGVELVSSGVRASLSAELANDGIADADQLITSEIQDGRLAGLLEVRDRVLPAFDDQLVELADGMRFALNAAHNDALRCRRRTASPAPAPTCPISRRRPEAAPRPSRSSTRATAARSAPFRSTSARRPTRTTSSRPSTPGSVASARPASRPTAISRSRSPTPIRASPSARATAASRSPTRRGAIATTASRTTSASTTSWSRGGRGRPR